MSKESFYARLDEGLDSLRKESLFKQETTLTTPQRPNISTQQHSHLLNFCANNYLGLSDHPKLIAKAQEALSEYGFGMSSVRFICGTQTIHQTLESRLSQFLSKEDTILYSSCFDANGGLFETILGPEDAVISDSLNHASIIDGIRLCKAKRFRYKNNDMQDLEQQLIEADKLDARTKLIATDGVFSMDGIIANLPEICQLAEKYGALVMVDDSHATGFIGKTGRGTPEYCGVTDKIDIITSTLGKALGGASGGFTSGKQPLITWLRQKSRPYLFSNSLAPCITATTIAALELIESKTDHIERLQFNTQYFRKHIQEIGFNIIPGTHPIVPVMLGDARIAAKVSQSLMQRKILATSFSYPVVPQNQARIRIQLSASHEKHDLDTALQAFEEIGKELNLLNTNESIS